jgi:hypothetical protein
VRWRQLECFDASCKIDNLTASVLAKHPERGRCICRSMRSYLHIGWLQSHDGGHGYDIISGETMRLQEEQSCTVQYQCANRDKENAQSTGGMGTPLLPFTWRGIQRLGATSSHYLRGHSAPKTSHSCIRHTHRHAHTGTRTHTQTDVHCTHRHARTKMQTHTHTQKQTHTNSHSHPHTHPC